MEQPYERNRYLAQPAEIDATVFVAESADLIGGVRIGAHSSIWYQTVIRCDDEPIVIGEGTNVQDGCVLHTDPGQPAIIGNYVTIGHRATVHGARIADNVMIAIGAVILSGATIGSNSIIGAGCVITEGKDIPPNSLVVGIPGRVIRSVSDEQSRRIRSTAEVYIDRGRKYLERRAALAARR
ncbi:MAG: gamma carbonic anhydrase family protein [Gammaproteobacteria bacterium]|nr:gamma carbonic anhydrase family protein [Gammaproteobacteria bacterium]